MTTPANRPTIRQTATPRKSRNSKPRLTASGMSTANSSRCTSSIPCVRATCRSAARSRARVFSTWAAAAACSPRRWRARAREVTAIDLAPSMVETARLHALDSGLTIDYRVEDAEQLLKHTPENSTWSPAWRCSSTCPIRPPPSRCSASWCGPAATCSSPRSTAISVRSLLAIVGAEYVANLVPRGTHEYERLLKPSEVARFARAAGLEVAGHRRPAIRPGPRAMLARLRTRR